MHDHQDGSECPDEDCARRPGPAEDASPVIQALCRAARLHHQLAWQLLRAAGLHPGQEVIMMRLWADGPQQPAALIRLLGSDAAAMTRSVQRLERAGFVRRKPSPSDRRAVIIEPTQASQALRAQVEAIGPRLEELCTRGFTDDERARATEILSMIERNMARAATEEGQGEEPSLRLAPSAGEPRTLTGVYPVRTAHPQVEHWIGAVTPGRRQGGRLEHGVGRVEGVVCLLRAQFLPPPPGGEEPHRSSRPGRRTRMCLICITGTPSPGSPDCLLRPTIRTLLRRLRPGGHRSPGPGTPTARSRRPRSPRRSAGSPRPPRQAGPGSVRRAASLAEPRCAVRRLMSSPQPEQ